MTDIFEDNAIEIMHERMKKRTKDNSDSDNTSVTIEKIVDCAIISTFAAGFILGLTGLIYALFVGFNEHNLNSEEIASSIGFAAFIVKAALSFWVACLFLVIARLVFEKIKK